MLFHTDLKEPPMQSDKELLQPLVLDYQGIMVYFQISNRTKWLVAQHFEADWTAMPMVLRIYDVTLVTFNGNNANSHFDIPITPQSDHWYIHGLHDNCTYLFDLGTWSWEHQFIPLLRSHSVHTPRKSEAVEGEPPAAYSQQVHHFRPYHELIK